MLQQLGHAVRTVSDGRQALEALRSQRPDVILLDIILPDLNGLEVLAQVQPTGIPVVTITGSLMPAAEMRQKGARGVLRKPFSMRQLRHAIEIATNGGVDE
jgi:CheY-like chemotaxis protein